MEAMLVRRPRLDLESLARKHTREAISTLVEIMTQKDCAPMARAAAAKVLLDHDLVAPDNEPLLKIIREIARANESVARALRRRSSPVETK